jgi:hypothetical protein
MGFSSGGWVQFPQRKTISPRLEGLVGERLRMVRGGRARNRLTLKTLILEQQHPWPQSTAVVEVY